jgi:1,4-dihydroxy-2-naphthoate octaprenyltransferase
VFSWELFFLGLVSVVATHLGANLLNDVADSRTGVDWQDLQAYGFFGGSKLIQRRALSEDFFLRAAGICFFLAATAATLLAVARRSYLPLGMAAGILVLASQYSWPPLRLSYRYLGELVIFLLFGPALVMGGYYIQTGIFPSVPAVVVSLPFGLLVMAILFANEIPDYEVDRTAGKRTWVALSGHDRAYIIYGVLIGLSMLAIAGGILHGVLSRATLASGIALFPAIKAASILRRSYRDKWRCVSASRLTIGVFTVVALVLVLDIIL